MFLQCSKPHENFKALTYTVFLIPMKFKASWTGALKASWYIDATIFAASFVNAAFIYI